MSQQYETTETKRDDLKQTQLDLNKSNKPKKLQQAIETRTEVATLKELGALVALPKKLKQAKETRRKQMAGSRLLIHQFL